MNLKKITAMALISVLAYVSVLVIKVPIQFLDYDAKDVIIVIGGLILGNIPAIIMSFLSSLLELTVGSSGIVGFLMNFVATVFYVVPIVFICRKNSSIKKMIIGVLVGTIAMSVIMILFNILISPIYLGTPLKEVLKLLPTLIIPFNLGKGIINGILIILIYKPIKKALQKANLTEEF